jgi:hypothetical protein
VGELCVFERRRRRLEPIGAGGATAGDGEAEGGDAARAAAP